MKKASVITMSVINAIALCILSYLAYWSYNFSNTSPDYSPLAIFGVITNLAGGILTLKRNKWSWGFTGLIVGILPIVGLFVLIMLAFMHG